MKTAWKEWKQGLAKGAFMLSTIALSTLYACNTHQGSTETDANRTESDGALANDTAMPSVRSTTEGAAENMGTDSTKGMDEVGTTHGTGSAGTTYGGDTDTSNNNQSTKSPQSSGKDGNKQNQK